MKKSIYLIIVACIFSHVLLSCKGKQGDPGPAGSAGKNGTNGSSLFTTTEGYAKCTATGVGTDGSAFSVDMDFEGSNPQDCYYIVRKSSTTNAPSKIEIQITKLYSGKGNVFTGDSFISIYLTFIGNDISEINQSGFQFTSTNVSINGQALTNTNTYKLVNGSENNTVSNVHYNSSTGILTGEFTVDYASYSNGYAQNGSLIINNGTFSSLLSYKIN